MLHSRIKFSVLLSVLMIAVFAFAFSLATIVPKIGHDSQYTSIERKDFIRTVIDLRVNIYDNDLDLTRAINSYLAPDDTRIRSGFSVWSIYSNTCSIYVVEPTSEDDFISWGHEIGHCVYGNWHP